jgi:hypothetical protein
VEASRAVGDPDGVEVEELLTEVHLEELPSFSLAAA